MDQYSKAFITALQTQDLPTLRTIPKSDLHAHCVLSGNREYLRQKCGHRIEPLRGRLESMQEMEDWSKENIRPYLEGAAGRILQMEAAFVQAVYDGVTVLEVGEDVWGLGQFFHHDIEELMETFQEMHERIAPQIELRFQIGLSRHCSIPYLEKCLEPFWNREKRAGNRNRLEYFSIDLYGDELAQPIENFIPIYERAKEYGIRRKVHVGEWGTAEDVIRAVELLDLDEVQHGIAAAGSEEAIAFLREKKIRLNITPTSNVLLGRVKSLAEHPIQKLYRAGLDVTINSDDLLMFDSDVSKEYLRLYQCGCLEAAELDDIRVNGLRRLRPSYRTYTSV